MWLTVFLNKVTIEIKIKSLLVYTVKVFIQTPLLSVTGKHKIKYS